uniref:Putative saposin n=1 Tax=Amblyomma aureolatum TaxID=187763 RepID=A0A1E1X7J6_9ACAR
MFARVLLAASVICLSNAIPLAKPSDQVCQTLSTSCQDLWVASSCKTVKPCIEMVWEKLEVPMDKSNVCNICKEMVKEARDQLLSNETQEELREVLEGSCALIPIGFISDLCKKMVDDFIPDLIDILVSRLDPDQVCTIAGLCNPDFVTKKLQSLLQHRVFVASTQSRIFLPLAKVSTSVSDTKKTATCTKCKTAMKYARELFQKLPLAGVKSAVLKVCQEKLGSTNPECFTLVDVLLPSVFKYLQSMDPEEFCAYLGHCKALTQSPPKLSIPPITQLKDNLTCDFCKQVVEHIRQILASNTSEQEFKQALLNFCEELGPAAEECQSIVDEYFDMVYSYLLEALDPDTFCSTIGLCTTGVTSEERALNKLFIKAFQGALEQKGHLKNLKAAKKVRGYLKPSATVPLIRVYPAVPKKYLDSNKSDIAFPMVKTFPAQYGPTVEDIYTCSICKAFITLLEQVVPLNATVDDVKYLLDQICELFPAETEKNCRSFVDKNAEVILKFLAHDVAPAIICHEIMLCSPPPPKKTGIIADSPDCDYCKLTVGFFYDELKKKETEEEIKRVVEKFCQLFPAASKDKCISTINSYVDMVISLILQEFTPEQICQELKFCASTNVSLPVVPPKKVSDDKCDLCMVVIKFVYDQIKDEKTEERIKQALDQVCSLLPDSLQQKCVNMVNTYYDMLVNLLLQELVPEQVCQELGLCSSAPGKSTETKLPTSASEECPLCEIIVKLIYNELKDRKTEEEIKQMLDKVCSLLPTSLEQRCTNTVNIYFDLLVTLITQGLSPEEVCQEIGLCPTGKESKLPPYASVSPKKPSDEECDICKVIVQFVYNELKDKKTEEEVKQLLDQVCSLLPDSLRQTCIDTVNPYYDQLVDLIVQGFTPEQVCQEIGLCTSARKPTPTRPTKVADDQTCTYCTTIVQYVYDALADQKTEEEIKETLDAACMLFHGDARKECTNIVNTYFEIIVSLILKDFTPEQICQTIGLCPSAPGGDLECTLCQYALHFIQNELVDNSTETQVEAVLENLCTKLPVGLAKECKAFVDEYGPAIMVLIAQEIDPSIVCVAIKACPKDGPKKQSDLKLSECASCATAVSYIEKMLKSAKNDQEVAKQVANACDRVPKTVRFECKALIEAYGPAVLQGVAQLGSSQEACKKLDLCSADETEEYVRRQLQPLGRSLCSRGPAHWCHSKENAEACKATTYCAKKGLLETSNTHTGTFWDKRRLRKTTASPVPTVEKETVAGDTPQCSFCKSSLDYVERCLMNRTAIQVMYRVSEICELFPGTIEQPCRLATDKNANIIYIGLKYHSDPATLCSIMTLCPHAPTAEGRESPEVPWGKGCDFGIGNEP